MDINLTGQIAATMAENLKPAWYSLLINASAGVVGGLVAGILTLKGVSMAQKNEDRRRRRDERKNAYQQFIAFIYKIHLHLQNKNVDFGPSWLENMNDQFSRYLAEIELLNPNIGKQILKIMSDYVDMDDDMFWNKTNQDIRFQILPQMQTEIEQEDSQKDVIWKRFKEFIYRT